SRPGRPRAGSFSIGGGAGRRRRRRRSAGGSGRRPGAASTTQYQPETAMDPRQACLACLAQEPPNLFEAALWIAAEHEPLLPPGQSLSALDELDRRLRVAQSGAPGESERAQWLL